MEVDNDDLGNNLVNLAIRNNTNDEFEFQMQEMEGILGNEENQPNQHPQPNLLPVLNQQNHVRAQRNYADVVAGRHQRQPLRPVQGNAGGGGERQGQTKGIEVVRDQDRGNQPPENVLNRGRRGVKAGRNQRRFNPYERDLKNAAEFSIDMVHASTARTREKEKFEKDKKQRKLTNKSGKKN